MERAIGSRINLSESTLFAEFYSYIEDLVSNNTVLLMENYIQHGTTTCFQHCVNVSYYNFRICRFLNLDSRSAARAGLLHDLYLYDWHTHKRQKGEQMHGFKHPKIALMNAQKYFEINKCEEDMILKHMFPLTISFPKYKETIIIVIVDKYCTILETVCPKFFSFISMFKKNKI